MKKLIPIFGCVMLAMTSCESYTDPTLSAPEVLTGNADYIYRKGATLNGTFIDASAQLPAQECGILVSEMASMPEPMVLKCETTVSGMAYSLDINNLQSGKTYYYQAYAYSGKTRVTGEVRSFVTTESNAPVFNRPQTDQLTYTDCMISASLVDDGGCDMLMSGFFWREEDGSGVEPTFLDHALNATMQGDILTARFTGLRPGKNYLIRPYGVNAMGVGLGRTIRVTPPVGVVPALSDIVVEDSSLGAMKFQSAVIDAGSSPVTQVGFCWSSTNEWPTLEDEVEVVGDNMADGIPFKLSMNGLTQLSTYHIRAYAINANGIGYSAPYAYVTPRFIELTSVRVENSSVIVSGELRCRSGLFWLLYAKEESRLDNPKGEGVIWSSAEPGLNASTGSFYDIRSGLEPVTTYYVRAIMEQEGEFIFSNTLSFQTKSEDDGVNSGSSIEDAPSHDW